MAKPKRPALPRPNPPGGRRHQPRELTLPDGATLVLKADNSIDRIAAEGGETQTWRPDDPEWETHALRFGLHQQPQTRAPSGRSVEATKPPRR